MLKASETISRPTHKNIRKSIQVYTVYKLKKKTTALKLS